MAQAAPPTAAASRARRINRQLARLYPDARIELTFTTPLELPVAAILSAHTTDRQVNQVGLGRALCDRFGGRVPDTVEDLVTLPGVGRKTANLVLGDAFGKPSLTVDTHFARLARRFGWTEQTDPEKIEQDVGALLPQREWTAASHRVTWHGRRVCHARRPDAAPAGSRGCARRSASALRIRPPRASSSRPGPFREGRSGAQPRRPNRAP